MMPRAQFSIRTMAWLTLVVAAFLGGMLFENARAKRKQPRAQFPSIDFVYGVHEIDLEDSICIP